ncbi:uncharacterized protein TNCV_63071 [Trichonephila clavipes]|nr:uncharacterized protein TNCV_63071 [Trichonephila clavipes]
MMYLWVHCLLPGVGNASPFFGGVKGTPRNSSACKQQQGLYTNYFCNPYGKAAPINRFVLLFRNRIPFKINSGCGSPVVKVSNHGRHVMSSIPVPLKTRRVGQRCTLNLSRAETSSRWCGVVVREGGASSGVVHVT